MQALGKLYNKSCLYNSETLLSRIWYSVHLQTVNGLSIALDISFIDQCDPEFCGSQVPFQKLPSKHPHRIISVPFIQVFNVKELKS